MANSMLALLATVVVLRFATLTKVISVYSLMCLFALHTVSESAMQFWAHINTLSTNLLGSNSIL